MSEIVKHTVLNNQLSELSELFSMMQKLQTDKNGRAPFKTKQQQSTTICIRSSTRLHPEKIIPQVFFVCFSSKVFLSRALSRTRWVRQLLKFDASGQGLQFLRLASQKNWYSRIGPNFLAIGPKFLTPPKISERRRGTGPPPRSSLQIVVWPHTKPPLFLGRH